MHLRQFLAAILAPAAVVAGGVIATADAAPPGSLIEAAKREGRLVVAGPPVQAHRETIMKFEAAYPGIKLEYNGTPPQIQQPRLAAERGAGKFLVDVFVSGAGATFFEQFVPGGWFEELRPALADPDVLADGKWIGGFDAGFVDSGRRYIYAFTAEQAGGLFINRDLVQEEFTFLSLVDPKWQGKIASLDPRFAGPGQTALQQIIANIGEDKTCQLLSNQKLVLSDTPKQIIDWAARATYPVLIGADTATLNTYKGNGLAKNIRVVKDERGTVLSKWGNVMLMNRAPNPNAAKLFINWLLSQQAQAAWAQSASVNSRRVDVTPGNPDFAIDAEIWSNGYNITLEKNLADQNRATRVAQSCLK
jgi:iron(III) transport system substrate-binding protein